MMSSKFLIAGLSFFFVFYAHAAPITVTVYGTDGNHQNKGVITFKNSPGGVLIHPNLHDLPPGPHGFHIHKNPSCNREGMAAGDHFDPKHTNKHLGPYEIGHAGDLPVLYVSADGESRASLIAPRLTLDAIKGHSVMIHAGSDNYTDTPPLGGGGPRIACGVIR